MAAAPPILLRPLDLGDLLDETFHVYRARFALFAAIALLLALPTLLVSYVSGQFDQFGFFVSLVSHPRSFGPTSLPPPGNPLLALLIYPVTLALAPFTTGALVRAATDVVFGQPSSVPVVLRYVVSRYWPLMGYSIIFSVLGFAVLLFPLFVWLYVRIFAAVPAMIAEGRGPIAGIERSWQLVEGRWWRTLLVVAALWLLQIACGYALVPLFGLAGALLPGLGDVVRGGLLLVGITVASALIEPLRAIGSVLVYIDFRVRREAMDLDQMARRAAAQALGA